MAANEKKLICSGELKADDYNHSANAIFHFMNKKKYLIDALDNQRFLPRYNVEDVRYLKIWHEGKNVAFNKIAVPEKCFCDIKLHNINRKTYDSLQKSHIETYGSYALGFSKAWAESNGVQPVLYINEHSPLATQLKSTINYMLKNTTANYIPSYENLVAYQLAFIKPLRGNMLRSEGSVNKNFHDEKEWRFVPSFELIPEDYMAIIMEQSLFRDDIQLRAVIERYNNMLESNNQTHLKFKYDDIKYIIVPNEDDRDSLIQHIVEHIEGSEMEKNILISKLIVLTDALKDW